MGAGGGVRDPGGAFLVCYRIHLSRNPVKGRPLGGMCGDLDNLLHWELVANNHLELGYKGALLMLIMHLCNKHEIPFSPTVCTKP